MAKAQKNLLFVICDQLQKKCLDVYGGPVETKAWNRLSKDGTTFERSYCASPMCAPTRPSMMTGRWPHAHGCLSFGSPFRAEGSIMNAGETLLIDHLLDNGYQVAFDGIWHIYQHTPENPRLNEYSHFVQREFPYTSASNQHELHGDTRPLKAQVNTPNREGGRHEWTFSLPTPIEDTRPVSEHEDVQSIEAITGFIENRDPSKPFAAWCSLSAPHPPILVPSEYLRRYQDTPIIFPASFGEAQQGKPRAVTTDSPGWQAVKGWTRSDWEPCIRAYYGYVAFCDSLIARLLETLNTENIYEDTLVIATADHGEMLGAHDLYQKCVHYEESSSIPFIAKIPGVTPGRSKTLASHVDMAPTILDALGLPKLESAQGHSLLSDLSGGPTRDYQFVEFNGNINGGQHSRSCISDRYKLCYHHEDTHQFFDLEKDPNEMINLYDEPIHAELIAEHKNALNQWMRDSGDFLAPMT